MQWYICAVQNDGERQNQSGSSSMISSRWEEGLSAQWVIRWETENVERRWNRLVIWLCLIQYGQNCFTWIPTHTQIHMGFCFCFLYPYLSQKMWVLGMVLNIGLPITALLLCGWISGDWNVGNKFTWGDEVWDLGDGAPWWAASRVRVGFGGRYRGGCGLLGCSRDMESNRVWVRNDCLPIMGNLVNTTWKMPMVAYVDLGHSRRHFSPWVLWHKP